MDKKYFAHSSADISPEASIGKGTKIWINAQVRENANIGENCILSKDVYIDAGVSLGNGCKVQNSVSIYSGVTIENDVFVGPNTSFTNDKVPRAFNNDWQVIETRICEGASLGANSTIVCGIEVGEYAMVAAGAVVTKDVEPYTLVMGNPAKFVGKVDKLGNRLK